MCNAGEDRQFLTLARLPISNSFNNDNVLCITTLLASFADSFDIRIDISFEMSLKSYLGSIAAIAQYNLCADDQYWFQSLNLKSQRRKKTCRVLKEKQELQQTLARLPISDSINQNDILRISTPLESFRQRFDIGTDVAPEMLLYTARGGVAAKVLCNFCEEINTNFE
jgi:hypothetical protein